MPQPVAKDMLAIDRAIVGLPVMYLEIVRLHYFYRLAPRSSMKRLTIHVGAWDSHLHRARQMVINRMRKGVAQPQKAC